MSTTASLSDGTVAFAAELGCTPVTVWRYWRSLTGRYAYDHLRLTDQDRRVMRAWHTINQGAPSHGGARSAHSAVVARLWDLARQVLEEDATGGAWLLLDLNGGAVVERRADAAAWYDQRESRGVLWAIPVGDPEGDR